MVFARTTDFLKTIRLLILVVMVAASSAGCGLWNKAFSSDNSKSEVSNSTQTGSAQPGGGATPVTLGVSSNEASSGVAPVTSSLRASFLGVWVGSFLDPEPAQRAVTSFQKQGLVSFSIKKTLAEKGLTTSPIGDYHLVLVGLFGEAKEAEALGRRLKAQGQVTNWQVVPSEAPQEVGQAVTQTAPLVEKSEQVTAAAQAKASRPLPPEAPVVTGEGFKTLVKGRFVGSYRDVQEAKRQANRLTEAGWPASVVTTSETGGLWYRVYLAEANDHRDYKPNPAAFESARASAETQEGLVLLMDTSGLKGLWGQKAPNAARTDASACAGYSETGRLLTSIERLVGYIPDATMLMVVKPIAYQEPTNIVDTIVRPLRTWWTKDDSELTNSKTAYGPSIYNRPEVMARIRAMKVSPVVAPVAPAISNLHELASIPGKKTVIMFSEFGDSAGATAALSALGNIKAQYGNLNFIVVYGDADDLGWQMAENLAKSGGSDDAWDGCRLVSDNSYFEKFVRSVFKK